MRAGVRPDTRAQATGKVVLSDPGKTGAFRIVQNWGPRMRNVFPRNGGREST